MMKSSSYLTKIKVAIDIFSFCIVNFSDLILLFKNSQKPRMKRNKDILLEIIGN